MSQDRVLQIQDRLVAVLEPFEQELSKLGKISTPTELDPLYESIKNLHTILNEIKNYFREVRATLNDVPGIPPAKELAQLVIGASTEALGALRETLHHLDEFKKALETKKRTRRSRDEFHYTDFSAMEAIRRSRNILNAINQHLESLPEKL